MSTMKAKAATTMSDMSVSAVEISPTPQSCRMPSVKPARIWQDKRPARAPQRPRDLESRGLKEEGTNLPSMHWPPSRAGECPSFETGLRSNGHDENRNRRLRGNAAVDGGGPRQGASRCFARRQQLRQFADFWAELWLGPHRLRHRRGLG